jgi:hypothetical protein
MTNVWKEVIYDTLTEDEAKEDTSFYFLHNPFVFGITHRLFLFPLIKVIQYYKHNLMEKEKDDGLYQKQMDYVKNKRK